MKNFNLILFAVFFAVVGVFVSCDDTNESVFVKSNNYKNWHLPKNIVITPVDIRDVPSDKVIYEELTYELIDSLYDAFLYKFNNNMIVSHRGKKVVDDLFLRSLWKMAPTEEEGGSSDNSASAYRTRTYGDTVTAGITIDFSISDNIIQVLSRATSCSPVVDDYSWSQEMSGTYATKSENTISYNLAGTFTIKDFYYARSRYDENGDGRVDEFDVIKVDYISSWDDEFSGSCNI